jgi:uncharacterized protein (TIGR00251 family)
MMLKIKVKPNSRKQEIEEKSGFLLVSLKSPPENNLANLELIKLLSKHFSVPDNKIKILKGKSSRNKIIEVKSEI